MKSTELEAKIKKLETQQKKSRKVIKELEDRITRAEDIEAIKKLQRAYGFYLEHWQEDELIALFSTRDDVTVEINDSGEFKGAEGVRKCYVFGDHYTAYSGQKTAPPEYLHLMVPILRNCRCRPGRENRTGPVVRLVPWRPAPRRQTPRFNRLRHLGNGLHQRRRRLENLETPFLRYFQQSD